MHDEIKLQGFFFFFCFKSVLRKKRFPKTLILRLIKNTNRGLHGMCWRVIVLYYSSMLQLLLKTLFNF